MKPEKNNTFCYFPFTQLALKDWSANHGLVNAAPCCNTARRLTDTLGLMDKLKNDNTITPEDIFHSKAMNELRSDMMSGVRNKICDTCWKQEDANQENTWSPRLFSYLPDDDMSFDPNEPKLQAIDFGLGENCNLRCRMCVPELSNKLRIDQKYAFENNFHSVSDEATIGFITGGDMPDSVKSKSCHTDILYFDKTSVAWNWVIDNIDKLYHIRATGGEVFVESAYIELLDAAIEKNVSQNINLHFHTNATKFSNTLIEKLKKFKSLEPNFSIDSVGKNYEYIRYPMPWGKLEKSVKHYIDTLTPYTKDFALNVAYSSLNAHYLEETYDWYVTTVHSENKFKKTLSMNISDVEPKYRGTNIRRLPISIREDIISILHKVKQKNKAHDDVHLVDIDAAIARYTQSLDEPYDREYNALKFYEEVHFFDMSRNQHYSDFLHADICKFLDEGKIIYEARRR